VIRCSVSPESEFFGLLRSDVYVLCRISFPCCYVPVTDGGLSVHKVLGMDAMSIHPTLWSNQSAWSRCQIYLWTLAVQRVAEYFFSSISSVVMWTFCSADQAVDSRPKRMWDHPMQLWESMRTCTLAE
jgi:hypothetical protein